MRAQGKRWTVEIGRYWFHDDGRYSLSQNLTCPRDVRTIGIAYVEVRALGWRVDVSRRMA